MLLLCTYTSVNTSRCAPLQNLLKYCFSFTPTALHGHPYIIIPYLVSCHLAYCMQLVRATRNESTKKHFYKLR